MTSTTPSPAVSRSREAAGSPAFQRINVRPARAQDAASLRAWRGEPTVRQHQPLREVSLAQLRADLATATIADLYKARGDRFVWIVEADGESCGWITLVVTNWDHGLSEIGYALSTKFQGCGIMTEALILLLPEIFLRTPLERIEARCSVNNQGSRRVLEKIGFTHEGTLRAYFRLRGKRIDHALYALLRIDYLPNLLASETRSTPGSPI